MTKSIQLQEGVDAFTGQSLELNEFELRPVKSTEQDLADAYSDCVTCPEYRIVVCEDLGIMPGMKACVK